MNYITWNINRSQLSLMVPFLAQKTRKWPHGIPGGKYFWFLLHYGHYISRDIFLVHNNFINKFCEPAVCHHQVAWLVFLLSPGILHTPFGGLDFCLYRVTCCWLWSFSVCNSFTPRRVFLQIKTRHRNEHSFRLLFFLCLLTKQSMVSKGILRLKSYYSPTLSSALSV